MEPATVSKILETLSGAAHETVAKTAEYLYNAAFVQLIVAGVFILLTVAAWLLLYALVKMKVLGGDDVGLAVALLLFATLVVVVGVLLCLPGIISTFVAPEGAAVKEVLRLITMTQ